MFIFSFGESDLLISLNDSIPSLYKSTNISEKILDVASASSWALWWLSSGTFVVLPHD